MKKAIDMTGKRCGRLTVLERDATYTKAAYWRCRCDCGKIVTVQGCHLRSGATQSCGCLNDELRRSRSWSKPNKTPLPERIVEKVVDNSNKATKKRNPLEGHNRVNMKIVRYTVYDNRTDMPVIVDATYKECAAAMGISEKSFFPAVTKAEKGIVKRWTFYREFLDGKPDHREVTNEI